MIALMAGVLAIVLALSDVMPSGFYFTFGMFSALVICAIEYSTFISGIKEAVFEKHDLTGSPSPFLYAPVLVVNIVFWGYGLTMHFLNRLDVCLNKVNA